MNKGKRLGIPVNDLMGRVFDLVVLNWLFILCCIPIITIGASMTALHRVLLQMVRGDDAYFVRDFFGTFRREFRQSTLLWLPMLLTAVVLLADQILILPAFEGALRLGLFIATVFFEVFWLVLLIYAFPMLARYVNPLRQTLKNAFLVAIWKFPQTILCAAIYLALPLAYMLFAPAQPVVMILYIICGFSVPALLADTILNRVFKDVIPGEQEYQNEHS